MVPKFPRSLFVFDFINLIAMPISVTMYGHGTATLWPFINMQAPDAQGVVSVVTQQERPQGVHYGYGQDHWGEADQTGI